MNAIKGGEETGIMTGETFLRETLDCLAAQRVRYPAMEGQDIVKFAFQAMLGVGHLLADRDTVTEYITREMDGTVADPGEPLTEKLSPAWCRLNLRRAAAEGIPASVIARLMLSSGTEIPLTRRDVYEFCNGAGKEWIADPRQAEEILDETRLPSHSPAYREQYHPAYRVISADWIPRLEAVIRIAGKLSGTGRLLVTLDGPCASGKTTLARRLAEVFGGPVVHTDEYVIPHAQKTPERLAVPGGNCDAERLAGEVAAPWKAGKTVRYRRYDCRADRMLPEEKLPDGTVLILEGSYCNLPEIRRHADVRLFMDTPEEVRFGRLRKRESEASLRMFRERWIPLENAYFAAYGLPDAECLIVR